uniref:TatD family hydrolase n=1 Tax=Ningiella ruwaisensis TaxID=2364274 RepID=UPI00109F008E|nr:TatD family hydrolase [Ningiella ruwaisensis]
MIDSHCHFDLAAFDADRNQVIQNCEKQGLSALLVPGLGLNQSQDLRSFATQYSTDKLQLDIAAGFHPYFLKEIFPESGSSEKWETVWQAQLDGMYEHLAKYHDEYVAVGEFGIDGTLSTDLELQMQVFRDQLSLAKHFKKPVILHHRKSHNELIRLLKEEAFTGGGVVHAFSGSAEIAHTYVELGLCLGIGGTITYPRGAKTRRAIADISFDSMLLETDAPDMPMHGYQGMRNTPERLHLVAQALAETKGVSLKDVIKNTTQTYQRLFYRQERLPKTV